MGNVILEGAMVHPIVEESFRGSVHVNNKGKIWQVAEEVASSKAKVLSLRRSWHITPTLIDTHSHIGMTGIYEQDECNDYSEPISPGLAVIDGYNYMSEDIPLSLEAGVGAACILPGSGSIIGGQCAVVKMLQKNLDKIVVNQFAGMKAAVDDNSSHDADYDGESNYTRMGVVAKVKDFFLRAQHYINTPKKEMNPSEFSIHFEALRVMTRNEIPFRIHCHHTHDIETAIRLFHDELDYHIVLDHVTHADKVVDMIAERDIPVVYGPYPMALRGGTSKPMRKDCPAILEDAGVKIAFMTDHDIAPAWSLQTAACEAVKHGMSKAGALRALTLSPAEICGVDDRLGSLARGRDADLVIWNKHPLDFYAKPLAVMIDGHFEYVSDDPRIIEALEESGIKYG